MCVNLLIYDYFLIFILALIGIVETIYLIHQRKKQAKLVCLLGKNCHIVLESKYNKILGIHNDIAGLFFIFLSV